MKKILVATDLSERSDRALERAVALAQESGARLTVLHVVDEDWPAFVVEQHRDASEQTLRRQLTALSRGSAADITTEVAIGKDYECILRTAKEDDAEIVVLGMHRASRFKDLFRGTTAERVIRLGVCPVMLVKDPVRGPYRRVLVAVDFSVFSRRAVEVAVQFVPNGAFDLVHAYDVPFSGFLYGRKIARDLSEQEEKDMARLVKEEFDAFLAGVAGAGPHLNCISQRGSVFEVIRQEAKRLKPDLLVLGTHGRTGVAHAWLGSVAEEFLREPPCDVLAVRAW